MPRSSFYAIRALTYLACQAPGKLSGTRDIARHERIPGAFLGKVLQQLRRGRLLRSYRGIGGGYELALPPEKITLLAVLRCMEAASGLDRCVLEDRDCSCENPCVLHEPWVPVQKQLLEFFENNTLAELVQGRQPGAEYKAQFRE